MAEFEEDDVFPETDNYLFIGGPKHGQYVEVVKDDPTHKVIVPGTSVLFTPNGAVPTSGTAEIHTYVKRDLGLTADDGYQYVRQVYVHEACPDQQVAQQLLLSVLMVEFIKGGRKVVTADGESG
jgi:hypothetical protein